MTEQNNVFLADEFQTESSNLLDQAMIKLENCFEQLSEQQVWWRPQDNLNSIGNLVLHSCGNLRQWAIASLTNQSDDRQRDKEFSADGDYTKGELLALARTTVDSAKSVIAAAGEKQLATLYEIQGFSVTGLNAILHTTSHFVGHTHQVIMLTRIQLGDSYQFAWSPDQGRDHLPI